jgi:flagellar L-ring protein precursor FlgH
MSARASLALALAAGALLGAGCGVQHIKPHTARHRNYDAGEYEGKPQQISQGSMWQDASRSLVADFRASRVGDLVTIRVDESPNAQGDAKTKTSRESTMQLGMSKMFGLAEALQKSNPNINPSELLDFISKSDFNGDGETSRTSRVQGSIAARVRKQLPNGDLFLEGTKVLMVNDEELHIYVSGVIRPEDIEQDNTVASGLIADAQIEFTGRGVLTDNQRQGWLTRLLGAINPF